MTLAGAALVAVFAILALALLLAKPIEVAAGPEAKHVEALTDPPVDEPAELLGPPLALATFSTPIPTPEPSIPPPLRSAAALPTLVPAPRSEPGPVQFAVQAARAATGAVFAVVARYFPEQPQYAYGVAVCESGAEPSTNTGNGYYGMWQFDLATWQAAGGTGLPSDASADEQTARARATYDRRGWQPWGCAT